MSFVAVTPAVLLIRQSVREEDATGAFRVGFWYGFAAQAAVLYWLIVALGHFTPLAAPGYLATLTLDAARSGGALGFVVRVRLGGAGAAERGLLGEVESGPRGQRRDEADPDVAPARPGRATRSPDLA